MADRVSSEVILALASFMVSVGNFNQSITFFQSLLAQSIENRGANPVPRSMKQNPVPTRNQIWVASVLQAARSVAIGKSRPHGRSQNSKGNASIDVMLDSAAANFVVDVHRNKNNENDQLSSECKLDDECAHEILFRLPSIQAYK